MKTLVAVEEPSVRGVMSSALRSRAYAVTVAGDGQAAWEEYKRQSPGLVVVDWRPPQPAGQQLCRRIRSSPDGGRCVILVLVGRDQPEALEKAVAAGADDLLLWPAEPEMLAARLDLAERRVAKLAEREQAEQVLRAEHDYSRWILNNTPALVCRLAPDRTTTYLNPAGERLTGYTGDELLGRDFWEVLFPGDEKAQLEGLFQALKQGDVRDFELVLTSKGGGKRAIAWYSNSNVDQAGHPVEVIGFGNDTTERRELAAALWESEERLQLAMDAISDGLYDWDLQTDKVYYNPRYFSMLGYDPDEFPHCRETGENLIHPEDRARALHRFAEYVEGKRDKYEEEFRLKTKDGRWRWVLSRGKVVARDAAGRPIRFIGIHVDVTPQKEAESRRLSEELLRAVIESTRDGILVVDEDGGVTHTNRRFVEMWQVPPELVETDDDRQLLALAVAQLVDPEAFLERVAELHQSSEESFDTLHLKDGRVFERNTAPLVYHGQVAGRVWSFLDVTERMLAEKARRESEERFRALIENSTDVTVILDRDWRFTYASPSVKVFGYSPAEVLSITPEDFFHPDDLPIAEEHLREAVRQPGEAVPMSDLRVRRGDGSWAFLEGFLTSLFELPGVNGIVFNGRDMTERKRAEEERRSLEEQIRQAQKTESLGVLAGGIAHDFNNLLMGVLGNADLALRRLPADSPGRDNLQGIIKATHRAADLTKQMLAYSGKGKFLVEQVDLSRVVGEIDHLIAASVSKKTNLDYDLGAQLPVVEADAAQMRQVILNLIANAAEAIGEEIGTISITTGVMHCDRQYLRQSYLDEDLPGGLYVYLEVGDTGCGMDEETLARIFDPFFTTKFTGRGLGMAAVLGIVRGHHGAIVVRSEPESGTNVRVLLPTREALPPVVGKNELPAGQWQASGTVLVVDDEPGVLDVAEEMLEMLGFDVLTAVDGRQAVELFARHADRIRLVLLDMAMPKMDGEEAFRAIRRVRSDAPVILSSGYNEQKATNRFAGQGLAGFIQKPYRMAALQEKIREVLEREMR